jgi:hypothetical protein
LQLYSVYSLFPATEEIEMPNRKTTTKTRRTAQPRNLKPPAAKVANIKGGAVRGESKDTKH